MRRRGRSEAAQDPEPEPGTPQRWLTPERRSSAPSEEHFIPVANTGEVRVQHGDAARGDIPRPPRVVNLEVQTEVVPTAEQALAFGNEAPLPSAPDRARVVATGHRWVSPWRAAHPPEPCVQHRRQPELPLRQRLQRQRQPGTPQELSLLGSLTPGSADRRYAALGRWHRWVYILRKQAFLRKLTAQLLAYLRSRGGGLPWGARGALRVEDSPPSDNEGAPPRRRRAAPSYFAPRRSCCARWAGRLTPAQREVAARLVLRLLAWVWGLCRRSAGPLTGAAGAAGCYWCYLGAPSPVGGRQALPAP